MDVKNLTDAILGGADIRDTLTNGVKAAEEAPTTEENTAAEGETVAESDDVVLPTRKELEDEWDDDFSDDKELTFDDYENYDSFDAWAKDHPDSFREE